MIRTTHFKPSLLSCFIVGAAASPVAFALEPASLTSEGMQVIPVLNTDFGYTDNVTNANSNEIDSSYTVINPSITFAAESEKMQYEIVYNLARTNYLSSSADNKTDHNLTGRTYMEFSRRSRLDLNAGYLKSSDGRGDELNLNGSTPDKYDDLSLNGTYEYGGKEATGRVALRAGTLKRDYDAASSAGKNKRINTFGTTFYYRVAPKTSMLAEYNRESTNYSTGASSDSTETEYLIGAEWDATAKTTGTLKVGWANKDFDDATPDADGFKWDIGVSWAPRTYSTFNLSSSREEDEASGSENYVETTSTSLQWTHNWTDKFASRASYTRSVADSIGANKKDTTNTIAFGADFDYKRWLNFSADYSHAEKDSTAANSDYTTNSIMFRVTASF